MTSTSEGPVFVGPLTTRSAFTIEHEGRVALAFHGDGSITSDPTLKPDEAARAVIEALRPFFRDMLAQEQIKPSRALVETLYQLQIKLSTREQREAFRAVRRIVHGDLARRIAAARSASAQCWTLDEIKAAWMQAQATGSTRERDEDDLENSWEHVRAALHSERVGSD